ncbi:DinB family protein [Persicitalea sp.]|uniref:DinB family protein n=1 Tax=Persicitalea sp. TaxID=3100273 RepID=UPI003593BEEF
MEGFFRDIFTYHFEFNRRVFLEIGKNLEKLPERTFPLYCHILNAHQIWNARILEIEPFGVHDLQIPQRCPQINKQNYEYSMEIIGEVNLNDSITYRNSQGTELRNKISDILYHIANHTAHHRGQIISDFRECGIEPIKTDYIFYKR